MFIVFIVSATCRQRLSPYTGLRIKEAQRIQSKKKTFFTTQMNTDNSFLL